MKADSLHLTCSTSGPRLIGAGAALGVILSATTWASAQGSPAPPAAPVADPSSPATSAQAPPEPLQSAPPQGAPPAVSAPQPYYPQPAYGFAPPQYYPSPSYPPSSPAAAQPAAEDAEPAEPFTTRFRAALTAEVAFGSSGPFTNYLFGPRLDYRFTRRTALGAGLRYANLKGPEGRAHNLLPLVHFEHRLLQGRHPEESDFTIPMRAAAGYLPKNGPYFQPALALSWEAHGFDVVVIPLAPTFWSSRDLTSVSFNFGLEVAASF